LKTDKRKGKSSQKILNEYARVAEEILKITREHANGKKEEKVR